MSIDIPPILQAALDHFKDSRKEIEVPEWNGKVIYAPPLSLDERNRFLGGDKLQIPVFADILIAKAEDINGEKLYTKHHKTMLLNLTDGDVVTRIGIIIIGSPTVEDAEKN